MRQLARDVPEVACEAGWHLAFPAPKSVSVAWALASEPTQVGIEQAHHNAVVSALRECERRVTFDPLEPPWEEPSTALFAAFQGGADQRQTPHLHTTVCLVNLGCRGDGRVGRFHPDKVLACQADLAQHYRRALGQGLSRELGTEFERGPEQEELVGVPLALCRLFSGHYEGTTNVEHHATELVAPLRREDLFARWRQQAGAHGWGAKELAAVYRAFGRSEGPDQGVKNRLFPAASHVEALDKDQESVRELPRKREKTAIQSRVGHPRRVGYRHSY